MILTFGCFLGALAVWELGLRIPLRSRMSREDSPNPLLPQTFAPVFALYA